MSYNLYLFSDATGETAERVVRAALSQFKVVDIKLYKFSNLRTRAAISEAVGAAASHPGLVLYTMVDPDLTEFLRSEVDANGLEGVDLISLLIYKFAEIFGVPPQKEPGLQYKINSEYHRRVEAVNFTVKQDDGQELRNLCKADMVLIGVSRTSKTPLSMYLAHKGYKIANVPLVKGIDPPREIYEVDPKRVVALIIDPKRLVELRSARLRNLRQNPRGSYADFEAVVEELDWCRQLYRKQPDWQVIDVTNKSVEESASEILRRLNDGLVR
jgi:[pyruvate, water dikinase]-phosphate phosphotransferase / [pyruvate, water dikinase] kinase